MSTVYTGLNNKQVDNSTDIFSFSDPDRKPFIKSRARTKFRRNITLDEDLDQFLQRQYKLSSRKYCVKRVIEIMLESTEDEYSKLDDAITIFIRTYLNLS